MIHVLNANTFAVSQYTGSAWIGVTEIDGKTLLLRTNGLDEQAGTTDNGEAVVPVVTLGMLNLGVNSKKYVSQFKTTLSGDGTTNVQATLELDGDTITIGPYELVGRSGAATFDRSWRIGGGVKADSFSLQFTGSGVGWSLHNVLLLGEPLTY
jgi:hypothetical protein